jgi:streptomycin 6-kinase
VDLSSPALEAAGRRLVTRLGSPVGAWWAQVGGVVDELADRWGLVVGGPAGRGGTALVLRCRPLDGASAVLKLTPDTRIAANEVTALRRWHASGRVPAVLAHEESHGAILLEAIADGTPLSRSGMADLWRIVDLINGLRDAGAGTVADGIEPFAERVEFIFPYWIERHSQSTDSARRAVPLDRLRRGHLLAQELARQPDTAVLLHGDLHPGNVLDGGRDRGLVAIDPRPCLGDPAVDAIDWVFWGVDDPRSWRPRCAELAARIRVDSDRLWAWCTAFAAMLAASRAGRGAVAAELEALLAVAP